MVRRKPMQVGDVFDTTCSGKVVIKEMLKGKDKAVVQFEDGTVSTFFRTAIVDGKIKNYNALSVMGVACVGAPRITRCRCYGIWFQMIDRCYSDKYPAYQNCTVSKEWLNFQNFKNWYEKQNGHDQKDFQLDKDILVRGNKVYGAEFCNLVPSDINKLLESSKRARGSLPLGVSIHKETQKYTARCCDNQGNYPHLGLFDTVEEAFQTYKSFKESVIKSSAERHKDLLTPLVYDSLMCWEIQEDD